MPRRLHVRQMHVQRLLTSGGQWPWRLASVVRHGVRRALRLPTVRWLSSASQRRRQLFLLPQRLHGRQMRIYAVRH